MKNGILFDFKSLDQTDDVEHDKEVEEIKNWEKKAIKIIEKISCQQEDLIEPKFQEAVQKAKQTGAILVIPSFSIIPKTIENLTILQKSEIDFYFADFEELSASSLPIITKFLSSWGQEKSEKIKAALSKKKAAGIELGNPKIDSPRIIEQAKKKRTFLAKVNPSNIRAMEKINILKEEKLNNNKIANILNQEGFKTRRGKQFHAKTVERLIEMTNEIKSRYQDDTLSENAFESNPELDKYANILRAHSNTEDFKIQDVKGTKKELPVEKFLDLTNFEKVIEINFKDDRSNPITLKVALANNKKESVFKKNYELQPNENNISIDIDKNNILPGLYYLRIISNEFRVFLKPIKIKAASFSNIIRTSKSG